MAAKALTLWRSDQRDGTALDDFLETTLLETRSGMSFPDPAVATAATSACLRHGSTP